MTSSTAQRGSLPPGTVLFVCEHGSAKSVVAAAHFNRLAEQRGLPWRAVSRGTDPDSENHPAAVAGLRGDGLQPQRRPCRVASTDLETALAVIAFSALPSGFATAVPAQVWTVPPVSEDYESSRNAIVGQVELLLADLARPG